MEMILYRTDPNEMRGRGQGVSYAVEYAHAYVPDGNPPVSLKPVRVGRTLVVIEGDEKRVQPYLAAIEALFHAEEVES